MYACFYIKAEIQTKLPRIEIYSYKNFSEICSGLMSEYDYFIAIDVEFKVLKTELDTYSS
jgi:hypothetical protein